MNSRENLTEDDLPSKNASYGELKEFAWTFNGYSYWGSIEACIAASDRVSEREKEASLVDLRTRLFMITRIVNHYGQPPEDLSYMHYLVECIKDKI